MNNINSDRCTIKSMIWYTYAVVQACILKPDHDFVHPRLAAVNTCPPLQVKCWQKNSCFEFLDHCKCTSMPGALGGACPPYCRLDLLNLLPTAPTPNNKHASACHTRCCCWYWWVVCSYLSIYACIVSRIVYCHCSCSLCTVLCHRKVYAVTRRNWFESANGKTWLRLARFCQQHFYTWKPLCNSQYMYSATKRPYHCCSVTRVVCPTLRVDPRLSPLCSHFWLDPVKK